MLKKKEKKSRDLAIRREEDEKSSKDHFSALEARINCDREIYIYNRTG